MDEGRSIIRKMETSRIEEHGHNHFKPLIPKDTKRVYPDKAYRSEEHESYLRKHKMESHVFIQRLPQPSADRQTEGKEPEWSAARSVIEPKMADLKRLCSMERMRYYGMERNHLWTLMCGLAADFKRTVLLSAV